jgi:hypothetical protein
MALHPGKDCHWCDNGQFGMGRCEADTAAMPYCATPPYTSLKASVSECPVQPTFAPTPVVCLSELINGFYK